MKIDEFELFQRVKTFDPDDEQIVYGQVVKIDRENEVVWILWDDLSDDIKHEAEELPLIARIK